MLLQDLQLGPIGQSIVVKQEESLFKADPPDQLVDVVSAIDQLPLLPEDIAKLCFVGNYPFQSFCFERHRCCRCHGACQAAESQQPDKMNKNYSLKTAPTALSKEQKSQNRPK